MPFASRDSPAVELRWQVPFPPHPERTPSATSQAAFASLFPSTAGEEWRGRPALSATVRLFSPSFFRKVITRHDTGGRACSAWVWTHQMLVRSLALCPVAATTQGRHGSTGHNPAPLTSALNLTDSCPCTGMGESYMDGDYEVDSLGGLLAVATANANNIEVRKMEACWSGGRFYGCSRWRATPCNGCSSVLI